MKGDSYQSEQISSSRDSENAYIVEDEEIEFPDEIISVENSGNVYTQSFKKTESVDSEMTGVI